MPRKSLKPSQSGSAAISKPSTGTPEPNRVTGEPADIKREFILTQSADETLQDAVRVLSRATGTSLTNSHFLRALLKTVAKALPQIQHEASRIGKLKRPSNAKGMEGERDEYERKLSGVIGAALRSLTPAEWGGEPLDETKKPRKSSH